MRGTVIAVNPERLMIAIETKVGTYSAIEVMDEYFIVPGDIFWGNLDTLGGEVIHSVTQNDAIVADVRRVFSTAEEAVSFIQESETDVD